MMNKTEQKEFREYIISDLKCKKFLSSLRINGEVMTGNINNALHFDNHYACESIIKLRKKEKSWCVLSIYGLCDKYVCEETKKEEEQQ